MGQLQKCRRIKRRLMSRRRLARQQVVGVPDPLLGCAGRRMDDKLRRE